MMTPKIAMITPKKTMICLRSLQLMFGLALSGALTSMVVGKVPPPSGARARIGVLLAVSIATLMHIILSFILTLLRKPSFVTAAGDLLSLAALITSAVLTRGVSGAYDCQGWLAVKLNTVPSTSREALPDDASAATLMRRELGPLPERSECGVLRGAFAGSIAGCILLVVTFQLLLLAIRAQDNAREEHRGLLESSWREDSRLHRTDSSESRTNEGFAGRSASVTSDQSEMKAFNYGGPLPTPPKPAL